MIIWINGAFGSGKTSAAYTLHRRIPGSFVYDPEEVGYFIRKRIPGGMEKDDFQDYPMWREMNYAMLKNIAAGFGGILIVPMTVTNPVYFNEIVGRLRDEGVSVRHFTLWASRDVLLARLKGRGDGYNSWPARQVDRCLERLANPLFEEHLDTDHLSRDEVVGRIAAECGIPLRPDERTRLKKAWDRAILTFKHIRIGK